MIAAARTAISRCGLRGARMEDIAAEAGVSRAAVYYHFNSKDDLAAALVDDIFRGITAAARSALADGPIESVIRTTADFFCREVTLARLLIADMPTPVDHEHVIGHHRDELLGLLRERLRVDMENGHIRVCDADVAAAAIAGLMRVTPIELIAGKPIDLTHFTDELCSFVRHALAPTDPAAAEPRDTGR